MWNGLALEVECGGWPELLRGAAHSSKIGTCECVVVWRVVVWRRGLLEVKGCRGPELQRGASPAQAEQCPTLSSEREGAHAVGMGAHLGEGGRGCHSA